MREASTRLVHPASKKCTQQRLGIVVTYTVRHEESRAPYTIERQPYGWSRECQGTGTPLQTKEEVACNEQWRDNGRTREREKGKHLDVSRSAQPTPALSAAIAPARALINRANLSKMKTCGRSCRE